MQVYIYVYVYVYYNFSTNNYQGIVSKKWYAYNIISTQMDMKSRFQKFDKEIQIQTKNATGIMWV